MINILIKKVIPPVISVLVSKAVTEVSTYFSSDSDGETKEVTRGVPRTYDTTRITPEMANQIRQLREDWRVHNLIASNDNRRSLDSLVDEINYELGLNKSYTTLRNYWAEKESTGAK